MTTLQILSGVLILLFIVGAGVLKIYGDKLKQDLITFLQDHHVKNAAQDAGTILNTLGMVADMAVRAAGTLGLNGAELLAQAEADASRLAGEFGLNFTPTQVQKAVQAAHQRIYGAPTTHASGTPTA